MCEFEFQQSVWNWAVGADVERCDWLFHPWTGVRIDWPAEVDRFLLYDLDAVAFHDEDRVNYQNRSFDMFIGLCFFFWHGSHDLNATIE